jgi:hypothetical protein
VANTIDKVVLQNDGYLYRLKYQVVSDGTGADLTDTVMIAKSSVPTVGLSAPVALDLIGIDHAAAWGVTRVDLEWDATTDDEIISFGAQYDVAFDLGLLELKDPISAGNTGDILITTKGMAANGGLLIIATFKVRAIR